MVWVVILVAAFSALGYLLWLYNRIVKEDGKIRFDFKNLLWLRAPAQTAKEKTDAEKLQ